MVDNEGIWSRGGSNVEELPDPFEPARPTPGFGPDGAPLEEQPKRRRRRWPLVLYAVFAVFFVTLIWLIVTAPLSRALEPLDDPAILLVSQEGRPIARRGAIKEAPVDVTRLDPCHARRLRRDRGPPLLSPLGHRPARHRARYGRQHARRRRAPGRQHHHAAACEDQLPLVRPQPEAQGAGSDHRLLARGLADEGRDPLPLSLERLFRRRRVRPAGRLEALFRPRAGESESGAIGHACGRRSGAFAACADEQSQARAGARQAGAEGDGGHRRDHAAPRLCCDARHGRSIVRRRSRPAPISPTGSRPRRATRSRPNSAK